MNHKGDKQIYFTQKFYITIYHPYKLAKGKRGEEPKQTTTKKRCLEEFLNTKATELAHMSGTASEDGARTMCQGAYSCSRVGCVRVTVAAGAFVSPTLAT